jgi:hypothetical protein
MSALIPGNVELPLTEAPKKTIINSREVLAVTKGRLDNGLKIPGRTILKENVTLLNSVLCAGYNSARQRIRQLILTL